MIFLSLFREEVLSARSSGDYSLIHDFYERTFSSTIEMNALFKRTPDQKGAKINDPEIKSELLNEVHDQMDDLVKTRCSSDKSISDTQSSCSNEESVLGGSMLSTYSTSSTVSSVKPLAFVHSPRLDFSNFSSMIKSNGTAASVFPRTLLMSSDSWNRRQS